jgi:hypothetical protein
MKVAVSLPDELYERADAAAASLGLNRSQLYARALDVYLRDVGDDPVTQRLNELADELDSGMGGPAGRHLIDSGGWEW